MLTDANPVLYEEVLAVYDLVPRDTDVNGVVLLAMLNAPHRIQDRGYVVETHHLVAAIIGHEHEASGTESQDTGEATGAPSSVRVGTGQGEVSAMRQDVR